MHVDLTALTQLLLALNGLGTTIIAGVTIWIKREQVKTHKKLNNLAESVNGRVEELTEAKATIKVAELTAEKQKSDE